MRRLHYSTLPSILVFLLVRSSQCHFPSLPTISKYRQRSSKARHDKHPVAYPAAVAFINYGGAAYDESNEVETEDETDDLKNNETSSDHSKDKTSVRSIMHRQKEKLREKLHIHSKKISALRTKFLPESDDEEITEKDPNAASSNSSIAKRRLFLDNVALLSAALLKSDKAEIEEESGDDDDVTHQSDLSLPNRRMWVVTTAALPWMTGTSVNPLLRAAYLSRKLKGFNTGQRNTTRSINETVLEEDERMVTLVVPWLELEEDRLEVYGSGHTFANENEQEEYIRDWMREKADLADEADPETGIKIIFYPARYHSGLRSIFAMGDICALIPDGEADVCILEEPEHLNWYRFPGDGWTKKFNYVVGVVHTNYKEYALTHYSGLWTSPGIALMSAAMVRAYCHKVIKLSDVLQTYAPEKEEVSNVHGVRSEFLEEGESRGNAYVKRTDVGGYDETRRDFESEGSAVTRIYFLGKIIWAKGLDKLLELEAFYRQVTGEYFPVDIYGSGPEEKEITRAFHGRSWSTDSLGKVSFSKNGMDSMDENMDEEEHFDPSTSEQSSTRQSLAKLSQTIKATTESFEFDLDLPKSRHEWRRNPIPSTFPGRVDHSLLTEQYKVFVNPSVTEVLCTATAEALAMGKFVIIPIHPSNEFFMKFPNCLGYRTKMEFAANMRWALQNEPEPLTPELRREFTWEAATERFIKASAITKKEARYRAKLGKSKLDERIAWFHNELGKGVKGDAIRKVLGGGPISDQVRYEMERRDPEQGEEGSVSSTSRQLKDVLQLL